MRKEDVKEGRGVGRLKKGKRLREDYRDGRKGKGNRKQGKETLVIYRWGGCEEGKRKRGRVKRGRGNNEEGGKGIAERKLREREKIGEGREGKRGRGPIGMADGDREMGEGRKGKEGRKTE